MTCATRADPNGTLTSVLSTGRVRVAAVDHVPWVVVEKDGVPRGAEVDLVDSFARELGVAVEWRRAPAFAALAALERGEVDLAVGGFTKKDVTAHGGAGQTYVFFTESVLVASEPGAPVPQALDGLKIYVASELMANGLVEDEGGVPVHEKTSAVQLAALPDWQLPARGLVPTDVVLYRNEHVMAVPQGENAWIMRLELFLRKNAHTTGNKLLQHAPSTHMAKFACPRRRSGQCAVPGGLKGSGCSFWPASSVRSTSRSATRRR